MNSCACGCGSLVKNRFKKGHYGYKFQKGHKINLGIRRTEETKRKMGLAHKGQIHYWKGGRVMERDYFLVYKPDHPNRNNRKYVFEHRLVMEKHLDRYLRKDEIVHHINRIRTDNRIENLQLMTRSEHMKYHRNKHSSGKQITGMSAFV